MTMKTSSFNSYLTVLVLTLLSIQIGSAQTLGMPTPAPNPNIASNSPWQFACGTDSFNEFFVNFTWNPPLVASDNVFILELSDANGNFSSPQELDRATNMNTTFDFDFSFGLTPNIQGDNYRFRVRSTSPALTSEASDAFEMYYVGFNSNIRISQNGNGTIPPGGRLDVCDGSTLVLTADNVPDATAYRYIWYRSGTILSETSNSLTVTESGMYFTEIDYGPNCTGSANTISNEITVAINTPQGLAVNTPASTSLCSNETVTLEANIQNATYLYTWYQGQSIVAGPTAGAATFTVDGSITGFAGDYSVGIEGPGICAEQSDAVTISARGDFDVSLDNPTDIVLLPGTPQTLSVTTTATNPGYQWFRDNTALTGETNSSLSVDTVGVYYVEVTETGGACSLPPKNSENIRVVLPSSFELSIDYTDTYSDCMLGPASLSVQSIIAIDPDGNRLDVTENVRNNFTYQWVKDGTAVAGRTSDEIQLNDASENGSYTLNAVLDAFSLTSNVLPVRLNSNQAIAISGSSLVICDGITPELTTTANLSGESYAWLRNGTSVSTTDETLQITQSGTYQLQISADGCPILSNEIVILDFDVTALQLDADSQLVFPEGESQTVTASGADSYEWFDQGNTSISNTSSVTLSEEGEYLLLARVGECQISRVLTVSFRDNFDIPNVITANGDGINDLWVIPNTYSRNSEVSVTIFNEQGEEVLNQSGYQNNWPPSSTSFSRRNQIFYYKIRNANSTLRQGTITVIR